MSVLARRESDLEHRRGRALVEMRSSIAAAIAAKHPDAEDAAIEAVGDAIVQLVSDRAYLAEPAEVKNRLFVRATRRMIDQGRCAENRYRHPVNVDENSQALLVTVPGELTDLTEEARREWRIREILSVLKGRERQWAEAWHAELRADRTGRGLDEVLGWPHNTTKDVARRARKKMAAFIEQRESGAVCSQRRELLDAFTLAAASRPGPDLSPDDFAAVLLHIAGCENCWAAWYVRRRSLVGRFVAILTLPLGHAAGAAASLRAKLAALLAAAHHTSYTLRQRVGIGGGTAATGGGVAAISGKAAAICGAVVCAAGAAGGAVVEAVPAILPQPVHHATDRPHYMHRRLPAAATASATLARDTPVAAATQNQPTTTATKPKKATFDPSYTPGDLLPASSQHAASPSSTPTATAASATSQASPVTSTSANRPVSPTRSEQAPPTCVPGDLAGC